jgi:hypothetical protein
MAWPSASSASYAGRLAKLGKLGVYRRRGVVADTSIDSHHSATAIKKQFRVTSLGGVLVESARYESKIVQGWVKLPRFFFPVVAGEVVPKT